MRLRTLLIIEIVFFVVIALAIGAVLLGTAFSVNQAVDDAKKASTLQTDFYQLSILRSNYLLYGEARARDQWVVKQVSTKKTVDSMKMTGAGENRNLALLRGFTNDIRSITSRLVRLQAAEGSTTAIETASPVVKSAVAELLQKNARISSVLATITATTAARVRALQRRSTWLIGIFVVLAAGLVVASGVTVLRSVFKPVAELQVGVNRVSAGDLDYTVPEGRHDEVGDLARSFNEMAAELKTSYGDLEREVVVRRKTEEELREHRDSLEELVRARTRDLESAMGELSRSNAELEQFAYVASHDLQEPLRMVSSFVQLLEKKYRNKLGDEADEFIEFAVDGARRMQELINDLLAYSRVGRFGKPFEPVDMNEALSAALANLSVAIDNCHAVVSNDDLPVVKGDRVQLVQLLQNLVSNAIKFRGREEPWVRVAASGDGEEWVFSVADNGIGFDQSYSEKIFQIFQRLQSRGESEGTGIGLAIAGRIVERHGGRIWAESEVGKGSVFYFSIPVEGG